MLNIYCTVVRWACPTILLFTLAGASGYCLLGTATSAMAQAPAPEPTGLAAAAAIERVVVDAIARNESSVVAIGLFPPRSDVRLDSIPDVYATGVVLDPRGLILTNYHVLPEAYHVAPPPGGERPRVHIRLAGRPFWCTAHVKGSNRHSDLAVLEIVDPVPKTLKLRPVVWGDASQLKRGQFVIALGNPYAIARDGQASAAWGIVSNLERRAPPEVDEQQRRLRATLHQFGTLIQTDAKLSVGTSGGALLNLKGEMIGLTTAIAALAGYEKSAGFAIAVDDTFRRVVNTLMDGREVEFGFLGIAPDDMRGADLAAGQRGVRINTVVDGTPAAAVLDAGDIVTHVAGEPVTTSTELMLAIGKRGAGDRLRLELVRSGQPKEVTVTLTKNNTPGPNLVTNPRPAWRGLRVEYPSAFRSLTEPQYSLPSGCVIVSEVAEGSAAARQGLRTGMRITHVENQPVDTPDKFQAATANVGGSVRLRLSAPNEPATERVVPAE